MVWSFSEWIMPCCRRCILHLKSQSRYGNWHVLCSLCMQMAGGGDDNFTEKKLEEECREFENPWWRAGWRRPARRTRDESVVNNHSFVVGDEGKIIHVESIWGQFHVRKTKKNEMPRLSRSSSAAQPRRSAWPAKKHTGFLAQKKWIFFSNWSGLWRKKPLKMILFTLEVINSQLR